MILAVLSGVALGIGVTVGERLGKKYVAPLAEEQFNLLKDSVVLWQKACASRIRRQYGDFVNPEDSEMYEDVIKETHVEDPTD
jgi:hypothetical protein